jgi:citrate lyase subunit beta/citryl-CoA lyase
VRRSRLYLPGNEPKFAINAGLHGPDGVILDLEDSVHPDEKDAARLMVRNALRRVDFGDAERMVRINQGDLGLEDLDTIVPESPDLILIPKVETSGQVKTVQARIDGIQKALGATKPIWLMPILESAQGVENAVHIALASPFVAALTIGLEDYTADLGVVKTPEGTESLWAKFLETRGEGLHHICHRVESVEEAVEKLVADGGVHITPPNKYYAYVDIGGPGSVILEVLRTKDKR